MSAPRMRRLRDRLNSRDERGAGGLLPIMIIGFIVIMVAATVASSTAFAAKINKVQVSQITANIDTDSLLSNFNSDIKAAYPYNPKPTATIANVGSYKVYYSASTTQPTSVSSSGVTVLPNTGIPATALWLLVEMTPLNSAKQTAIYSYTKKGSQVFDTAVSWSGPVKITNSVVQAAPGTEGPVYVVTRETSSAAASQALTVSGSTIAADVYATYANTSAVTGITAGKIRGNLSSKSKVTFTTTPTILGSAASGSTITGTANIAGTRTQNSTSLATPPGVSMAKIGLNGYQENLAATDCSTPAKLKAKLESYTAANYPYGVNLSFGDLCAASSWATTIKPNVNIVVNSQKALSISGLTVSGSKASLGFASTLGLTFSNVNYINGGSGPFIPGTSMTATNSVLVGSISSVFATTVGTLTLSGSTLLYDPVESPVYCPSGTNCSNPTTMSSTLLHLERVS